MKEISVGEILKPLRLDKYLTMEIKNISRKKIDFLIKEGKIKIEGKTKIKPSFVLKGGEKIYVDISGLEEKEPIVLKPQSLSPEPKILYEDEDLIVIDKPAGIIVHPSLNNLKLPSIASWLIKKYPFLSEVGEDRLRPGIVHRLDKETSGVLVVAKNNFSFNYLKNLFKERKIRKKYIALVRGEIKTPEGEINLPLGRSKKSPMKRKVIIKNQQVQRGKAALTKYRVLKRFQGYTLLEVIPETGRTHQIRVHLASIGFPVVGDRFYGKSKSSEQDKDLNLSRHFLHAQEIAFLSPKGNFLKIESPLPLELKGILQKLRPKID
ncbi:MAG: RluA family pseudouridine synthase [Candidatus Pacebacteria bacterium]|nr:RluA family pseudouridine synthase [Candidatus Paceibacterota bacterium]